MSGTHLLARQPSELGKNSPELREAYEQTLPLLSEYSTGHARRAV